MKTQQGTYHKSLVVSSVLVVHPAVGIEQHTHWEPGTEWAGTLLLSKDHRRSSLCRSVVKTQSGKMQKAPKHLLESHSGLCHCKGSFHWLYKPHNLDLCSWHHGIQDLCLPLPSKSWQSQHPSSRSPQRLNGSHLQDVGYSSHTDHMWHSGSHKVQRWWRSYMHHM